MNNEKKENGLGIAGMVLGIIAVVTSCFVLGGLFGTIGLILSIIALTNKTKKKGMAIAGVILNIIAIAIAMAVMVSSTINNQNESTSSVSSASAEVSASSAASEENTLDITEGYATMDKFNQIEIGMTYDEVVDIVGSEGTLMSEAGTGEYKISIYYWYSVTHLANMNVSFENGVVAGKAQVGLE